MTPYDTEDLTLSQTEAAEQLLARLAEQGRQHSSRLNEEFGAIGVQLRQQHLDLSDRLMSLQAGVGAQFDALAAAVAATSAHVTRSTEQLAERNKLTVATLVQQELSLQLLPLQARLRMLSLLCAVSTVSALALAAVSLLR